MRLIDADALLHQIGELKKSPWFNDDSYPGSHAVRKEAVEIVEDLCIKDAPTADRPQGEWIAKTENYHSHWVCSECGAWALLEYNEQMCLSHYCPNCGARMKGADDE